MGENPRQAEPKIFFTNSMSVISFSLDISLTEKEFCRGFERTTAVLSQPGHDH